VGQGRRGWHGQAPDGPIPHEKLNGVGRPVYSDETGLVGGLVDPPPAPSARVPSDPVPAQVRQRELARFSSIWDRFSRFSVTEAGRKARIIRSLYRNTSVCVPPNVDHVERSNSGGSCIAVSRNAPDPEATNRTVLDLSGPTLLISAALQGGRAARGDRSPPCSRLPDAIGLRSG